MFKLVFQNISVAFVFFACIGFAGIATYSVLNVLGDSAVQSVYTVKYNIQTQSELVTSSKVQSKIAG